MLFIIIILLAILILPDFLIIKYASQDMRYKMSILILILGILILVGGGVTLNNLKSQSFTAKNSIKSQFKNAPDTVANNKAENAAKDAVKEMEDNIGICYFILIIGGIITVNGGMLFVSSGKKQNYTEHIDPSVKTTVEGENNVIENKENLNGFCEECGQPLSNETKFCPNCGKKIN